MLQILLRLFDSPHCVGFEVCRVVSFRSLPVIFVVEYYLFKVSLSVPPSCPTEIHVVLEFCSLYVQHICHFSLPTLLSPDSKDNASNFIAFRRYHFRISVRIPIVLTEISRRLSHTLQAKCGTRCLNLDQDHFLPDPFQFIVSTIQSLDVMLQCFPPSVLWNPGFPQRGVWVL